MGERRPPRGGGGRELVPVLAACLCAVALLSCSTAAGPAPPPPAPAQPQPVSMNVVAHNDDDLLFMNPDVVHAVRGGQPTVTVFLTAGESNLPDAAGYAASRQAGSRAAYARMAGVPDDWAAEALTVGSDAASRQVELYTLRARPDVRLIFVNLPDDNDPRLGGGRHALSRLWRDGLNVLAVPTLVPAGGVVPRVYDYRRRDLVDLLSGLFQRYRPTLIRSQDAQPDRRYSIGWQPYHDHPDHVMAARFTDAAVRAYRASGANPRFVQASYRDYNISEVPPNLAAAQQRDKDGIFGDYARFDQQVRGNPGIFADWTSRMLYRWPRGTTWAARDAAGRVQVFAVQAGQVLTWWQRLDGGWGGPATLGDAGGFLAGAVSVALGADGRLQVLARRLDDDRLVALAQRAAGEPQAWPAQWQDLGGPDENGSGDARAMLGAPVVVAAAGGLVVFVRNGRGGVSSRGQPAPGGGWQDGWTDLGGTDVQDGLAAATTGDGRIELYAATRQRLVRWHQKRPGSPLVPDPAEDGATAGRQPAGPPALAVDAGGRLRVFYREAGTTDVVGSTAGGPAGSTAGAASTAVPGPTGPGGLAVAASGREMFVFARNQGGAIAMARAGQDRWTDLGGAQVVDQPTVVQGEDGRITLVGVGDDGHLMVDEQAGGPPDQAPFQGWRPVGS